MSPSIPARTGARKGARLFMMGGLAGLAAASVVLWTRHREQAQVNPNVPTTAVKRADVDAVVLTSGRVASSRSTEIHCMLERLELTAENGAATQAAIPKEGASAIIALVPDGATVKKGEVICEFDASDYEELARRQQIVAEEATAAHLQASLALEVARLALRSYREGEKGQVISEYKGEIALTKADLSRQEDRLAWSKRMLEKGYASAAQVASDQQESLRLTEKLQEMELTLSNFDRYTAPKESKALESDVAGAEATLRYQASKLAQEQSKLARYKTMVERCTIRAPHDGYVVYANRPFREPEVYLGAPVRERMKLFSLPDATELEVEALLHETDVDRIHEGMPAHVVIEAMPGRPLTGRVESVTAVPKSDQNLRTANQIAYFIGRVALATAPPGLRPGMTAEISILTDRRRDVLTVPTSAIRKEEGQHVCYVDRRDRLERRPVKVVQASHDLTEVVEGLAEGERVVLEPQLLASRAMP